MSAREDYRDPWSQTDQDAMFAEIDRLRSSYDHLVSMAAAQHQQVVEALEAVKEDYRDCASELAAERRHHAHLQEMCDAWMNGVADVVEPLGFDRHAACGPADLLPGLLDLETTWRLTSQVIYLEQQRWQEMAEDLWEELQEWHAEGCPTQPMAPLRFRADGTVDPTTECTCHRILATRWDEITHAADYAEDDEVAP